MSEAFKHVLVQAATTLPINWAKFSPFFYS